MNITTNEGGTSRAGRNSAKMAEMTETARKQLKQKENDCAYLLLVTSVKAQSSVTKILERSQKWNEVPFFLQNLTWARK